MYLPEYGDLGGWDVHRSGNGKKIMNVKKMWKKNAAQGDIFAPGSLPILTKSVKNGQHQ